MAQSASAQLVSYSATPTTGPVPLAVNFSAPSVDLLGVSITGYSWDFGDGGTSTVSSPSHTYTSIGTFTPVLTVTVLGLPLQASGPSIVVTPSTGVITWTNLAGGVWNNPTNWSPNQVPTAANTILITTNGTYAITLNVNATVSNLVIGGAASGVQTLQTSGFNLIATNAVINSGGILSLTNSTITGAFGFAGGAVFNISGATLSGQFTVENGSQMLVTGTNSSSVGENGLNTNYFLWLQNGATLNVSGANLVLSAPMTNSGTCNFSNQQIDINTTIAENGGLVNLTNGVINLIDTAGIYGETAQAYLVNQGTINVFSTNGASTINVNNLTNSATLNAEHGTLELEGTNLILVPSGTLSVGLNNAADYGSFYFNNGAALDLSQAGTFLVTLNDGYLPAAATAFQVLTYPSVTGSFTTTNLPAAVTWQASYGATNLTIQVLALGPLTEEGVAVSTPTNGASFTTNQSFTFSAAAYSTNGVRTLALYTNSVLVTSISSNIISTVLSNLPSGGYQLTAVETDNSNLVVASAVYVTINVSGTILIDFDPLVASATAPVTNDALADYLGQYGVSVIDKSPGTSVAVENQTNVAGGGFVTASSQPNLLTQIGSNGPVSFKIGFTDLLSHFSFTRPELLANPYVTHPAWRVEAFDSLGVLLDSTSAPEIFSTTNVPAQTYTLKGGGIASVRFSSTGTGLTTFNAMLLDDFVLTAGNAANLLPSVVITGPTNGQVFTASAEIPISAEVAAGSGTVTNVAFYYGNTLAGSAQASPYSILWEAPSNGIYALSAVAVDNSGLSRTSAVVTITAATGFAFETLPISQTIGVGNNATFSVTTTGTNVSYQWQFNGANLSGATNSSYTVGNAPLSAAGNYSVVVTNSGGQFITSSPAALSVLGPPKLGVISIATNGGNIILSVNASNSAPFYSQWQLNGNGIPGATNSYNAGTATISFTFSNAPLNSGNYELVAANVVASANTLPVTVNLGPTNITTTNGNFASSIPINPLVGPIAASNSNSPASGELPNIAGKPAGSFLWFNWTASFTGIISLTTRGSSFDTLLGVYTGSNLDSLMSVAGDDDSGGYFTSLVSFNCTNGTTYQIAVAGYKGATGNVLLGLSPGPAAGFPGPTGGYSTGSVEPVITQQPLSQIVQAGATVTLNVTAPSNANCQWYFDDVPVAGGTNSVLTISNFPANAVGDYDVELSYGIDAVPSATAAIQIAAENQNGTVGSPTTLAEDKFGDAVDLTSVNSPTHYRRADGGGDTGGFTLSQSFSTVGATKEEGEPNHAGQPGGASYWYAYTAPASGTLQFNTTGSTFNTILAIYTGPGASFSTLVSAGSGYTTNYTLQGQPVVLISNVIVGTTFFVAIDGYMGDSGNAQLNVLLNPAPLNVSTNVPTITNSYPAFTITYPPNNFVTASSNITVKGKVRGIMKQGEPVLSFVQMAINGNGFGQTVLDATNFSPVLTTGPGGVEESVPAETVTWSSNVALIPGANIITAQSISVNGVGTEYASSAATHTVFYVPTPPSTPVKSTLTLLTNGNGRITGLGNGSVLEVNKIYTVRAVPAGNWVFSNWLSGTNPASLSALPNGPTLPFVMASNLIVQANFVTNPFTAVAGTYNGLFSPASGPTLETSGFLTATIPSSSRGAYSGKLLLAGGAYPFSGAFDLAGDAQKTVVLAGATPIAVILHVNLNLPAPDNQMTGLLFNGDSNGWGSDVLAERAVFSASNPATNFAGRYTLIIPPGPLAPTNQPGGFGYVILTNSLAGNVTINGQLGDGATITQTVPVSLDGNIPLYVSLYSRQGSLMGWLTLVNNPANNPTQTLVGPNLSWFKSSSRIGSLYSAGFTNTNITALGSFYVPVQPGTNVMTLVNGTLTISDGNSGNTLVYSNLTIFGDRLINNDINNPPNPLSGVINPSTGIMTITFRPTGAEANLVAKGVVLQSSSQTNGGGWVPDSGQSGFFLLQQ